MSAGKLNVIPVGCGDHVAHIRLDLGERGRFIVPLTLEDARQLSDGLDALCELRQRGVHVAAEHEVLTQ